MSNYIRANFEGGSYFFTLVTFDRRPFLTTPLARGVLKEVWKEVQNSYPFTVEAICLLPDHLHCIWRLPEGDNAFSKRWNSIKAKFTKRYLASGGAEGIRNDSRNRKGEAAIWQRRFWEHLIRNEEDFEQYFHYIHFNLGFDPTLQRLSGLF
ncbi:transposase [bacterium]|nr:transposase [bacterium]